MRVKTFKTTWTGAEGANVGATCAWDTYARAACIKSTGTKVFVPEILVLGMLVLRLHMAKLLILEMLIWGIFIAGYLYWQYFRWKSLC